MIATPTVEGAAAPRPAEPLIDAFVEYLLDARGFSVETAKAYRAALRDFERRMPEHELSTASTKALDQYLTRMAIARLSRSTRRLRGLVLRHFFWYVHSRGYRADNPGRDLRVPAKKSLVRPPTLTRGEVEQIVWKAEFPPKPVAAGRYESKRFLLHRIAVACLVEIRDTAVLALVYTCGLRAGETALLLREDYDEATGELLIRGSAKHATEPVLKLVHPRARMALGIYLDELRRSPWASHEALFPPLFQHVRTHRGPGLSDDAVRLILRKRIDRAGIEPHGRRLSLHIFRYSLGTHLHEKTRGGAPGMTEMEIGDQLRHRTLDTTRHYIRLASPKRLDRRAHVLLDGFGRGQVEDPVSCSMCGRPFADSDKPAL